jgi:hypothetical protein
MALARRRRPQAANYWPGFVDMLSTLLLVVTFLMSLFMLSSYFITQQTSGKDTMLSRLNRQLSQLTELLALERSKSESTEDSLAALQATLADKEKENARLTGMMGEQGGKTENAEAKATQLGGELEQQKQITNDALAKVEILNQQLAAGGARCLRGEGQGQPGQDRRSRPEAERSLGEESAGARPLPLRLFRQAERGARQSRRLPSRRRPLRVSLRRAVRFRLCGAET